LSGAGGAEDLEAMLAAQWGVISDCHLLERALRRLPPPPSTGAETHGAPQPHFFDVHAPWMLPPLLELLAAVHAVRVTVVTES
jgi:hypothetical protein